jgi:hypothetical protein
VPATSSEAVNLQPRDAKRALKEMSHAGLKVV